jgi:23S rRNA (adenine2503-C2)-methyltransferase
VKGVTLALRSPRALVRRDPSEPAPRFAAWSLLPGELAALGLDAPLAAFAALHRPWRWSKDGPVLSRRARLQLAELGCDVPAHLSCTSSRDGSTKLLLDFSGERVEAVHMPRAVGEGRVTLCVSSQVGCAMGCVFCATAAMGFKRQLSAGEIVAQIASIVARFGPRHPSSLSLVFMGMGEPLHNLNEVARAVQVLCCTEGLGLSPRRITVSTAGLVPQIRELGQLGTRPLLAVSLNATTDELRQRLMPIGRRHPLAKLKSALIDYPLRARERITIEYVLLAGVNDTDEDALRLSDFCAEFPHNINLIPFNPHPLASFGAPSEARLDGFARTLLSRRKTLVTVRRSRGSDIQGACGQLVQS